MKKLLLIIAASIITLPMMAQDDSLADAFKRIEKIEQQLSTLNATVQDVTAQNLALKQALHLQPTISEVTTPNGINFRLISAKGDKRTGNVTFVFSVVNTTKRDLTFQAFDINFVDENGYAINVDGTEDASIANHRLEMYVTTLYPDTPVEMKINVALNSEPQYAKLIDIVAIEKTDNVRFINIPIKWE